MGVLREWWPAITILGEFVLRLMVMARVLLRGPRRPSSTLAWLMIVLALPLLGWVLWFMIGESRLGDRRRRRHDALLDRIADDVARRGPVDQHEADLPDYRDAVALACAVGGTPPRSGNRVELMSEAESILARLVEDIDAAQEHCHLLFFIYLEDKAGRSVAAALERAVGRGVACRLLLDDVGSRDFLRSGTCARLRRVGVQVVRALPVSLPRVFFARIDLRNHRKVAVIDGRIGYTGSQNIAAPDFAPKRRFAPWVDCMLRIEGPVVRDLQALFVIDWYLDTEESLVGTLDVEPAQEGGIPVQVLPTGPGADNEALEQLAIASFHRASEELILTTPYFVPGEAEVSSLCTTARRGVRVVLVLPAKCDSRLVGVVSRSHYPRLLEAGVEVHEFQAGLLHAKTLTVDRRLALVTTANFDQRSFELNYEVSTLVYDDDFASQLRFLQMGYLSRAVRIDPGRIEQRGIVPRLFESAVGVLSPLL